FRQLCWRRSPPLWQAFRSLLQARSRLSLPPAPLEIWRLTSLRYWALQTGNPSLQRLWRLWAPMPRLRFHRSLSCRYGRPCGWAFSVRAWPAAPGGVSVTFGSEFPYGFQYGVDVAWHAQAPPFALQYAVCVNEECTAFDAAYLFA